MGKPPDVNEALKLHQRVAPGSAEAYALATSFIALAALVRWALGFLSPDIMPFPLFYPAVFVSALLGGVGPGLFATALAVTIGWWAFVSPPFSFLAVSLGQQISLGLFVVASLLLVWGAEHYRRLTKRLEDEETFRKLAVEELAHRLRNKVATIQSIIAFELRDDPKLRDNVLARLNALSTTDKLIEEAQGSGAQLRDIITTELGPYGGSRISAEGPTVLLPPKLALTMALLIHELATNAAKYGALSGEDGHLLIRWVVAEEKLTVKWDESGGPTASAPPKNGFGMRLLSRALQPFDGGVESEFAPQGFSCKMVITLSQDTATTPSMKGHGAAIGA